VSGALPGQIGKGEPVEPEGAGVDEFVPPSSFEEGVFVLDDSPAS
jgi:hypothetical protein